MEETTKFWLNLLIIMILFISYLIWLPTTYEKEYDYCSDDIIYPNEYEYNEDVQITNGIKISYYRGEEKTGEVYTNLEQ